jgi:hypothetical protein
MTSFLQTRMRGEAPLETVFWRDMLAVGTVVNLAATVAAFALFAAEYPAWLGLAVNFLPLPWNLFLFVAVWRSAEREGGPSATTAKVVGVLWFAVMIGL